MRVIQEDDFAVLRNDVEHLVKDFEEEKTHNKNFREKIYTRLDELGNKIAGAKVYEWLFKLFIAGLLGLLFYYLRGIP